MSASIGGVEVAAIEARVSKELMVFLSTTEKTITDLSKTPIGLPGSLEELEGSWFEVYKGLFERMEQVDALQLVIGRLFSQIRSLRGGAYANRMSFQAQLDAGEKRLEAMRVPLQEYKRTLLAGTKMIDGFLYHSGR